MASNSVKKANKKTSKSKKSQKSLLGTQATVSKKYKDLYEFFNSEEVQRERMLYKIKHFDEFADEMR